MWACAINRSSSMGNAQGKVVGVMGAMEPEIAMLNKHVQNIETIKVRIVTVIFHNPLARAAPLACGLIHSYAKMVRTTLYRCILGQ